MRETEITQLNMFEVSPVVQQVEHSQNTPNALEYKKYAPLVGQQILVFAQR